MTGTGFYEQKRFSPTGLGIVIALHAGAIAAVAVMKGPEIIRYLPVRTTIFDVPIPDDPPEVPPPPIQVDQPRNQVSQVDAPIPVFDLQTAGLEVIGPPVPAPPLPGPIGTASAGTVGEMAPALPPMRIDAAFDPRFADALQPPYPTSEERAQRNGSVRVRVTIGADGRVKSVERVNATSDAFWRATERHALSRWRFRPATVDGRPVESRKELSVLFRIEA